MEAGIGKHAKKDRFLDHCQTSMPLKAIHCPGEGLQVLNKACSSAYATGRHRGLAALLASLVLPAAEVPRQGLGRYQRLRDISFHVASGATSCCGMASQPLLRGVFFGHVVGASKDKLPIRFVASPHDGACCLSLSDREGFDFCNFPSFLQRLPVPSRERPQAARLLQHRATRTKSTHMAIPRELRLLEFKTGKTTPQQGPSCPYLASIHANWSSTPPQLEIDLIGSAGVAVSCDRPG